MAQETQKSAAATEPVPPPVATQSPAPTPSPAQPPKAEAPAGEKELAAPAPAVAPEKAAGEKEASAPEPKPETTAEKPTAAAEGEAVAAEAEKANIIQSISFKEDSNVASELPESQRKALEELKELVKEALNKHEFTAPPPAPAKEEEKKEDKAEEKKSEEEVKEKETKEEEKKEEEKKEETAAAPATDPAAAATQALTETKPDEKPVAPATTTEAKKEEKPAAPAAAAASAAAPTKPEEKSAAPAAAETKKEEKPAAPAATEEKKEEKPAAPAAPEAKKEEKPAAPAAAEAKTEEKPAASAVTEAKKEEKPATPAPAPAPAETKPEVKPAASESITIEKAFAADEDGAKTVEAIKESIVPVSIPAAAEAPKEAEAEAETTPAEPEEVSIWGIPLLQDERSDVILLKFLRARDFKVKEAFTMLKNTVRWRKDFKIDELLEEDLGNEFEKMVFVHGVDKQGRTVIYSSYSEFQNKELFSDKEKRNKFLKWRIQFQEKCVRSLDFSPTAKSSFVFISDFKNAPGLGKRALWQFIKQAVKLFEDNYPEFVSKEVFINVPWWYIPYYRTIGSFTSPRTTSKMSLAGPSKSADAIFRYVAPEQVPVKYGGLSKESEQLFTHEDAITEVIVKPTAKHIVELPASEACTLAWELRVLGSDVSYGAQFEPSAEGSYTVIVSKNRKISLTDEPVITDSFKVGEPGKVVITIDNQTSKKKKLLYRFKTQPRSD